MTVGRAPQLACPGRVVDVGGGGAVVEVVVDDEVVVDGGGASVVVVDDVVEDVSPFTVKVACATACAPEPVSHQAWMSMGPGAESSGIVTEAERWSSVEPVWGVVLALPAVTYQPAAQRL
jgi:hypothetical protein